MNEATILRRKFLIEGYSVIIEVLPHDFFLALQEETNCLNSARTQHPDARYQGTSVELFFKENPLMKHLPK